MKMKCINCKKEFSKDSKVNYDYEYDNEENVWCMPCAEQESDGGNVY